MPKRDVIIAIDQGTTSSRTLAFSKSGEIVASAQKEFPQIYPANGWVEHNPEDIWDTVLETLQAVYKTLKSSDYNPVAIGITNQRETTLVWDRATSKPIYNAIVWQDRRTAEHCRKLEAEFGEDRLTEKTGLLFDPYFSASKVEWILDHVDGARERAAKGELAFGTVDSFLLYRLSGGQSHLTDATNASRTNLFNIRTQSWDEELLRLFNVPASVLPEVRDCSSDFGQLDISILGEVLPVYGIAGDQQAAAIGQACFAEGTIKSTYGTGCFVILNTGETCLRSKNRLLSTVCYRLDGKTTYALEGSIFVAGAGVQWLRDEMKIIADSKETEAIAKRAEDRDPIYLVPAFTGLGAPYWDPDARGAVFGMTRNTNQDDFVRAALESVCYQTHDLLSAMSDDGIQPQTLRVDGGMVVNNWMVQRLSDLVNVAVDRPEVMETTALGAAYLAGLKAGIYESLADIETNWQREHGFAPQMDADRRASLLGGWKDAVSRVLTR